MAGLSRVVDQMIGGSLQQVLLPSASYATTANSHVGKNPALSGGITSDAPFALIAGAQPGTDYLTSAGKYLHLIIDITVFNAGTLTVTILGVDPVSGKSYTILASAGLIANGTTVLKVGPALTAAANLVATDFVPLYWGVGIVISGGAMTFSLAAMQMP